MFFCFILTGKMEKYKTFTISGLKFCDTLAFLNNSLSNLVQNLASEGVSAFPHLSAQFGCMASKLLRKGIFPYTYVTDASKLLEKNLPGIEHFYNDLAEENVSVEDYEYAKTIFKDFKCKNLGEYADLYLATDVALLADVFANFRQKAYEDYGLDVANFISLPSFSYHAMLKQTGVKLEIVKDVTLNQFIAQGIRGGVSVASIRHCKANNPYMQDYNCEMPNNYIMYLDVNNL